MVSRFSPKAVQRHDPAMSRGPAFGPARSREPDIVAAFAVARVGGSNTGAKAAAPLSPPPRPPSPINPVPGTSPLAACLGSAPIRRGCESARDTSLVGRALGQRAARSRPPRRVRINSGGSASRTTQRRDRSSTPGPPFPTTMTMVPRGMVRNQRPLALVSLDLASQGRAPGL